MDVRKLLNPVPQPTHDVVMQDAQLTREVGNVIDDSTGTDSHHQRRTVTGSVVSDVESARAATTRASASIVPAQPRAVDRAADGRIDRSLSRSIGDGQDIPLPPSLHVSSGPVASAASKTSSAFLCELCAVYGFSTTCKTASTFYGHLRGVHMLLVKTLHRPLANPQLLTPLIPWEIVQFNGPMPWGFEAAYHTVESRKWENGKRLVPPNKHDNVSAEIRQPDRSAAASPAAVPGFTVASAALLPHPAIKRFQDSRLHRRLLYLQSLRQVAQPQPDRPREVIDLTADEEERRPSLVPKTLSDDEMLATVCNRALLDIVSEAPMLLYRMPHVIINQASAQQCTAADLIDAINRERWKNGVRKRLVFEGGLIHEV